MDIRNISRGGSETGADGVLLCFQIEEAVDEGACSLAFLHDVQNALDRFQDLVEFSAICRVGCPALAVQAIGLLYAGANGPGGNFGTHHSIAEAIENPCLEFLTRNAMTIRTVSRVDMVRTCKPPLPAKGIRPAAASAVNEA
ncbi:hypothetical protein [Novosphingobium panipatense]|uniref:hypothetical protein n=1 Tax=Novosphingobium panipatense TaxID=428991 RepID=UPI001F0A8B4B|nr:hypothetical protein [Novosphingobium panipatense]